jgi:hypothetical protein
MCITQSTQLHDIVQNPNPVHEFLIEYQIFQFFGLMRWENLSLIKIKTEVLRCVGMFAVPPRKTGHHQI